MKLTYVFLATLVLLSISQSTAAQLDEVKFRGEVIGINADTNEWIVRVTTPTEIGGKPVNQYDSGKQCGSGHIIILANGSYYCPPIEGVTYLRVDDICGVTYYLGEIDSNLNVGDSVDVFGYYLEDIHDTLSMIHYISLYRNTHYLKRADYIHFTAEASFEYDPHNSGTDRPSTTSNQPPSMISLSPSVSSPHEVGASITWTAMATDPENDPIYYQFWLRGPGTGEEWQMVQDWSLILASRQNTWTWWAGEGDVGSSDIQVRIRDGLHADSSDMDDFEEHYDYEIKTRQLTNLNAEVTNAVYSEKDRRVYYCQEGKYFYVKNRVYLTGSDLDKVKKVTYYLHETFPNPVQVSTDRSNEFEIWIWTWGRFPIYAEIEADSGQIFEKSYEFSFKSKYEEAKRRGIPMVRDC